MTETEQRNPSVRAAVEGAPSEAVAADADLGQSLLDEFAGRAGALGVTVERLADSDAAARAIARMVAEVGAERIVVAGEIEQAAPDLIAAIDRLGTAWAPPGDAATLRHEPLGASLGRLAIAETGSMLLAESSLADRAIGMLVAVQVILCRTDALVPSLDEAAPLLNELAMQPGGAYATLVTGPSRTADIERVLTVGVQGPGRVIVLFIDELT
jgi:L-lactate dehydrogenase complex protein LldG